MFHTIAYSESVATATFGQVNAVQDDILRINNNNFVLDMDRDLIWASHKGPSALRARLVYPKARQITNPYIRPVIDASALPSTYHVADYLDNPLRLPQREEIQGEAEHDEGTAQVQSIILGIARGPLPPRPAGERFTMRGTSTTSAAASVWTTLDVTWPDILPNGTYACIGFVGVGAGAVAYRLIFEDQVDRPGSMGLEDTNQNEWRGFRDGTLGVWGRFTGDRMPNVQALPDATLASHTLYLDFVRVA